jgi:hypothetical protein
MVDLVFTGKAGKGPDVRTTENGITIATFPVDVKEQTHLPPTRILVVATGKQPSSLASASQCLGCGMRRVERILTAHLNRHLHLHEWNDKPDSC